MKSTADILFHEPAELSCLKHDSRMFCQNWRGVGSNLPATRKGSRHGFKPFVPSLTSRRSECSKCEDFAIKSILITSSYRRARVVLRFYLPSVSHRVSKAQRQQFDRRLDGTVKRDAWSTYVPPRRDVDPSTGWQEVARITLSRTAVSYRCKYLRAKAAVPRH